MQVHITVGFFAQTAAVVFTQHLTAVLCSRRHVEQVPAQWSLKIRIQFGAAGLWGGGGQMWVNKLKTLNTELLSP